MNPWSRFNSPLGGWGGVWGALGALGGERLKMVFRRWWRRGWIPHRSKVTLKISQDKNDSCSSSELLSGRALTFDPIPIPNRGAVCGSHFNALLVLIGWTGSQQGFWLVEGQLKLIVGSLRFGRRFSPFLKAAAFKMFLLLMCWNTSSNFTQFA